MDEVNQNYWEKNIKGFAGFYDEKSEEDIHAIRGFKYIYKKILFPFEQKYMFKRHKIVSEYILKNVFPGMKVADIGCGSGVYTKKMISRGAFVYAIDYTESAICFTNENLTDNEKKKVEIIKFDITKKNIPKTDLVIAIGVLPYIKDYRCFFENILPYTNYFLFNYLSESNVLNFTRRIFPFLNVRYYYYHNTNEIIKTLSLYNYCVTNRMKIASGLLLEIKKK